MVLAQQKRKDNKEEKSKIFNYTLPFAAQVLGLQDQTGMSRRQIVSELFTQAKSDASLKGHNLTFGEWYSTRQATSLPLGALGTGAGLRNGIVIPSMIDLNSRASVMTWIDADPWATSSITQWLYLFSPFAPGSVRSVMIRALAEGFSWRGMAEIIYLEYLTANEGEVLDLNAFINQKIRDV